MSNLQRKDETEKFKEQAEEVEHLTGKKLVAGDWCNLLTGECFRRDEDGNVTKLEGEEADAVFNACMEARGSLADVARAQGQTLAEAFLSCDAIVIVDTSASMAVCDLGEDRTRSRYLAACDELRKLQEAMPGKVAVVSFSSSTEFCPGGVPHYMGSTTDMADALRFVKIADGAGIKLILISDGEPDSPSETMRIARTFTTKIDTIFIGPESSHGAQFLRDLSAATGGIATTQKTSELHKLGSTVKLLVEASR